jgi:hypothetical protein
MTALDQIFVQFSVVFVQILTLFFVVLNSRFRSLNFQAILIYILAKFNGIFYY